MSFLNSMMNELGPISSFLSSFTWALGATAYSSLSTKYSSPAVNFSRALVALPLFCLALYLFNGQDLSVFSKLLELKAGNWFWFAVSILGSFALGDTLFFLSTHSLGVPAALAIASIYPIWAALAGWLFLDNSFHPMMVLGVLLVVIGTVLVILVGHRRAKSEKIDFSRKKYWLGVVLAFSTSIFWALNAFSLSIASEGISPLLANIVRGSLSLALCPVVGLVLYQKSFSFIPLKKLKAPLWIFVLEAFGGSLLFLYGINHSSLATAAALSSLAPVIALVLAWSFKREVVSLVSSGAVLIVVIGIWLLVGFR